MLPSRRPRYAVRHWRTLLASLALITTGTHASAQEQTAHLLKDANRIPDLGASVGWILPVGTSKNVLFSHFSHALGTELYISDGTPKGTRVLKDIVPGPDESYPANPFNFGSDEDIKVAFSASRYDSGSFFRDLWITDGTEAGTTRVFESLIPGNQPNPCAGTTYGFFFETTVFPDGEQQPTRELYYSDGTAAGTWHLNPLTGTLPDRYMQPGTYVTSGSVCYFIGKENEIWASDGTQAGTWKVVTMPTANAAYSLAVAGSNLFIDGFVNSTHHVWSCPTAGGPLTDITSSGSDLRLLPISTIGGQVFLYATDLAGVNALWTSDGTVAGTRRIPLVLAGESTERPFVGGGSTWRGNFYFTARNPQDSSYELWRSDGTDAGTVRVKNTGQIAVGPPLQLQPDTSEYFYLITGSSGQNTLWQTQGDEASTRPLKNTPPCFAGEPGSHQLANSQAGLIFAADQYDPDAALYRVKGKNGGAIQLTKPVITTADGVVRHPGPQPSYELLDGNILQWVDTGKSHELWRMKPDGRGSRSVWKAPDDIAVQGYEFLADFRGFTPSGAVFSLANGQNNHWVGVTDGTKKGTRILSQHETVVSYGYPFDFQQVGDLVFYSVGDSDIEGKYNLWKTDGTVAGTSPVLTTGGNSPGSIVQMVTFQGSLYFLSTGNGKTALWRSDGTPAGTVLVKDEWQGVTGELAISLSVAGGKLYFAVVLPTADVLWESDGTTAGTMPTNPMLNFARGSIRPAVDLAGVAVFLARGPSDTDEQWWRHLGNDTRPVRDGVSGLQITGIYESSHAVAGTQLFYTGYSADTGGELWVTDGTSAGTRLVKDIKPGPLGSSPVNMLAVGNAVYFSARDATSGFRLWRSDGSEAGTVPVAALEPAMTLDALSGLKAMAGKLYFHGWRRDVGDELHYIDLPLE